MTKKLHELIEMARSGQVFEATHDKIMRSFDQDFFKTQDEWSVAAITADWTVRMKREPRVQWIEEGEDGSLGSAWDTKEEASKHGKPIKFIEVMEQEKGERG